MGWINVFGLIIMIMMLIPNIAYAMKNRDAENKCTSKAMNIIEQVGRYSSMFLMVFNIGIFEFGFWSDEAFAIWLIVIGVAMLIYWLFWFMYFQKIKMFYAMMLAIIPSIIFIFSGIMLRHWLLVAFGCMFSVGHLYVTYQNNLMITLKGDK